MAKCTFANRLSIESDCGTSDDYPGCQECIPLVDCKKDVSSHIARLKLRHENIDCEINLLLARAGIFSVEDSHLTLTICPKHRSEYGIRWRCSKINCTVPDELALHKFAKAKGSDRVNSSLSEFIFKKTKKLLQIGTPMCRRCSEHISGLIAEEKEEFTEDPQHTCETAVALSTDVPFDVTDSDGEEEDLIEQLSRIDVTNDATFLSPTSSSMTLSSDADQPSKQDDPRDKLNQFLSSCNIPAVEKAWNDWNVVSDKTKKRYTKKAADIVSSVLYVLSPKDSALLWLSLIESPYMREVLGITDCPQSTKNYLEMLAAAYNNAETWDTRRQILSIFSGVTDFQTITLFLPGLTRYRFDLANLHANQHGVGAPVPHQTTTRIKVDLKQLDHFLSFVTSPHIIQDLPFGERKLKLSSGQVIEVPNVIRTVIPQRIARQYTQYCQETGFKPFSERTMLRILSECSASIRTSLQGLDYFVAEGAEAFDNLITIAHNIAELGGGIEWERRVVECLKASKLYLKGDFKTHLSDTSTIADHCIVHSLSDPTDKDFEQKCSEHEHNDLCSQCEGLKSILSEITNEFDGVAFANTEDRDETLFLLNSSKQAIQAWKCHLLRSLRQDQARLNLMDSLDSESILLVNDWAMKFLPKKYRESQSNWFGKRGLSWHISVVYRRVQGILQWQGFVHVIQSCSQDSMAVVPIVQHILKTLKEEHNEITKAFLRQDNAGCYHAAYNLLACPEISTSTGIEIKRVDFSDPQGGKGAADRLVATCKSHIKLYINEGNDVTTAAQMKSALLSNGGIEGVRVVALENVPPSKVEYAQKIQGISKLNNFKFSTNSMTAWRAFEIGGGKDFILDKQPEGNTHTWIDSDFSPGKFKAFKDKSKPKDAHPRTIETSEAPGEMCDPTADGGSGKAGVYSHPKDGCVRVFQTFAGLEKHLSIERCLIAVEKQTLFDIAKVKYKEYLEEGAGVLPSLKCSSTTEAISILPAEEGWALKENKTRSRFSEKQKSYLTDKFNIGQRSGRKVSPESVARDMRRAKGPDGGRLFDISDFLKPQQISSFFSRLAAKVRQSVPDDLDVNAIEEEENFSSARAAVMSSIHLEHPITYDSYDLCSLVKNSKLRSLKVPMLQIICQALELDVPVPAKKLKKPYVELIKNVVYNCGC